MPCELYVEFFFAEWVEYTPYEIGMAKYGTFMRSELFNSVFFCGKLVKKYPEAPLHYLQGNIKCFRLNPPRNLSLLIVTQKSVLLPLLLLL